jgi:exoribonuclease-2
MVTDAMLMAGEAAARFAHGNKIAIPYVMQPPPEEIRQPQGMPEMYAYRRLFKPSRVVTEPEPHFGLGLDIYARATSPLRRYSDLLVHQQLRAFVQGREVMDAQKLQLHSASLDGAGATVRRAERLSNQHWKLVHLARYPDWKGEGVVVALEERKSTIMIPQLAMETRVRRTPEHQLAQTVELAVREVDLPGQAVYFHVR